MFSNYLTAQSFSALLLEIALPNLSKSNQILSIEFHNRPGFVLRPCTLRSCWDKDMLRERLAHILRHFTVLETLQVDVAADRNTDRQWLLKLASGMDGLVRERLPEMVVAGKVRFVPPVQQY